MAQNGLFPPTLSKPPPKSHDHKLEVMRTQEPPCPKWSFIALVKVDASHWVTFILYVVGTPMGSSGPMGLMELLEETKTSRGGKSHKDTSIVPFSQVFTPKHTLQPAVVALGDLGHLSRDPRHLEVIHLEDPSPWDVDIGGLGDVDDGFRLGARDVVEVGVISTVEAGLEKGPKWRIRRVNPTHGMRQPPIGGGGGPIHVMGHLQSYLDLVGSPKNLFGHCLLQVWDEPGVDPSLMDLLPPSQPHPISFSFPNIHGLESHQALFQGPHRLLPP